jgi:tetratricopeptide (TPR) repeat protein
VAGADPAATTPPGRRFPFLLGALLFLVVAGVFLPAVTHDFITYDDPVYVTGNAHVTGGLTWADVGWAFRSTEASNWHPLTWLSHMADCQVFGVRPWGHHLTSVLLHAFNAFLLFVALRRMTGALWRSLFVAALFGLHPLHVESVAWVSERKDVLSTTFWMLVLWAYARRAEFARARNPGSLAFYGLAVLFFALGLMCKPMLVTLPCVLLLLDYWPLNRWGGSAASARVALVAEKLPFFALSAAASAVTLYAQRGGGTVASVEDFPWPVRLANALVAYCWYLGKAVVPAKLAVFYPYFAESPPLWEWVSAAVLLAAVTATSAALARRRPYLLVGWLWYLGTLVPVIGLVQVGGQAKADRYSYVPLIGLFIMAAWSAGGAPALSARRRRAQGLAAAAVLAGLAIVTSRQLAFWKDGTSLFRHALAVTENNWVAHANLSASLAKSSPAEAAAEHQETLRILAAFADTYVKKGIELERTPGRLPDAIKEFRTAVRILPVLAGPHFNLGTALARTPGGRLEAIEELRTATRLKPDFVDAHFNLATVLAGTLEGRDEAVAEFETVIRLSPGDFLSHFYLGQVLARIPGRRQDAIEQFEAALAAKPDLEQARRMIERLRAVPQ